MIALGSDHGGYKLKEEIKKYLEETGIEYKDYGTYSEERTDYPVYAKKVAEALQNKKCDNGILICRSGYGMTVVANKYKGIRAASIHDQESAKYAKADDDINVITLGGDYLTTNEAISQLSPITTRAPFAYTSDMPPIYTFSPISGSPFIHTKG